MLRTVHLFYPSFEKGGATKNLVRIVNFLLKKASNLQAKLCCSLLALEKI